MKTNNYILYLLVWAVTAIAGNSILIFILPCLENVLCSVLSYTFYSLCLISIVLINVIYFKGIRKERNENN